MKNLIIRPGIAFTFFLSSICAQAQVEFVAQEGIGGNILSSYIDEKEVLHCISEGTELYYYSFDLRSNRIISKAPIGKPGGRVHYDETRKGFLFYSKASYEDSAAYLPLGARSLKSAAIPPGTFDSIGFPRVWYIVKTTYAMLQVKEKGSSKNKNYYTGINQYQWTSYTYDNEFLYALSARNALYIFNHKKHKLIGIIECGNAYSNIVLSSEKNHVILNSAYQKAVVDIKKLLLKNIIYSQRISVSELSYNNSRNTLEYSSDRFTGKLKFNEDGYSNSIQPKLYIETETGKLKASLQKKHLHLQLEGFNNLRTKVRIRDYYDLTDGEIELDIYHSENADFYLINLKSGVYDQLFCAFEHAGKLEVIHINSRFKTGGPSLNTKNLHRVVDARKPNFLNEYTFEWNSSYFVYYRHKVYRFQNHSQASAQIASIFNVQNLASNSVKLDCVDYAYSAEFSNTTEKWALMEKTGANPILVDYTDSSCYPITSLSISGINSVAYNRSKKRLFYTDINGNIWVYNLLNNKVSGKILIDVNGGVIFQSIEGNIFSSSKEIRSISVNKNGIGDLHDYISYLNTPSVLRDFGLFSDSYYELHSNAKKRIGLQSSDSLTANIQNPPEVNYSVNEGILRLRINSEKETRVVINGREEYRSEKKGAQNVELQLNAGSNKIKVYNYSGNIPGIPFTVHLENTFRAQKKESSKIFFAGLGINQYRSTAFSPLRYAVKDIEDMSSLFRKQGVSYTYTNGNALRDSFMALKQKLAHASEDDIVIIHLSGHGILDRQGKFYFCTWDMDTSDPAKNGITVDDISSIFENCRSRKRMVIIDACHSGFIDRSLFSTDTSQTDSVVLAYKGASSEKLNTSNIDKDPAFKAFKLMLEAYPTFELYTGINMMAAAAGYEYALEMTEWQNGALTYAIKEALIKKAADSNGDKIISIEELKDYIIKRVPVLTNGSQSPDFRLENLEYNWLLW